jgi:Flp pilus assembly protein TadG
MSKAMKIVRDSSGAAAVEMALALPILIFLIYGIFSLSLVLEAKAAMQHALGQGARLATLCPSVTASGTCVPPTDSTIVTRMQDSFVGTGTGTFNTPTVTTPTSGCTSCRDLTVTYDVTPSFLFFNAPSISLSQTKRVYLAT